MNLKLIHENLAHLLVPIVGKENGEFGRANVFYNPKMELERDISILAFQCFQKKIGANLKICDLMTGCGVRGIRYALEIDGASEVILNDLNPSAISLTRQNMELNDIDIKLRIECQDSNVLLNLHAMPEKRFDIIDIDPFGSPSSYLDSAARAINAGGLLAITATDLAPLCGINSIACKRKYGSKPLRTEYCHEIGARILIGTLVSAVVKNDLALKILLCYHYGHYTRIYAIIEKGILAANNCLKKMGYIAHCFNCLNRATVDDLNKIRSSCNECGEKFSHAGPLWLGEFFDKEFVKLMLIESRGRNFKKSYDSEKILNAILFEKQEYPLFFVVDKISSKLQIKTLSVKKVIEELESKGFGNSITHFHRAGFRTNAKIAELKSIFKDLSRNKF